MSAGAARSSARRVFIAVFGLSLAVKLLLAAVFPLTGDEALFIQWGLRPDTGYYDHPPMIGWWLALALQVSDALVWLRLLSVAETHLIALGLVGLAWHALAGPRQLLAWWAGTAYLLLPWSMLFVLVTTDSALVLWAAVSMACYLRADRNGSAVWYAAAGWAVGLAFLSKYLAVLLGVAYLVHVLRWRRERWKVLPGMFLMALPAIVWNLGFNVTHGWPNILFNLFNRHEAAGGSALHALQYLAMGVYLLTPWLLYLGARRRRPPLAGDRTEPGPPLGRGPVDAPQGTDEADDQARRDLERATLALWAVPLLVFAVVSLRREVGLHWLLAFVPPFVLWVTMRMAAAGGLSMSPALRRAHWASAALSAVHVIAALVIALSPLSWWTGVKAYERLVFLREAGRVATALAKDLPEGATLFATGYSQGSTLAYHHGRFVPVFGSGSRYARQDDLWFDFRALDGRDVRVFSRDPLNPADFEPYFGTVRTGRLEIEGATFHWLDGWGFRYGIYRERVLADIQRRYHRIPPGWPVLGSPFCDRYGFSDCAAR